MSETIVEKKQKSSYTHDKFGNEYKVPLDQLSVDELKEMLKKMNHANAELLRLSEKYGWGI